ncbi:hypothetical protein HTVC035P_gp43 [Pelagibacter phage HTVC035P]|nr:hypothetical protein HTVC035P_gp43 [Pelagibacter phage HTVC035P]
MAITKIQSESMNLADTYAFTGTVTGAGGQGTNFFQAVNTGTSATFTHGASVLVPFDAENYDPDGVFDPSSGNYKFTCQTAGYHFFTAQVQQDATGGKSRQVSTTLYKNGSNIGNGSGVYWDTYNDNTFRNSSIRTTAIVNLAVNDYVQVYFYQTQNDSGSNILKTSGNYNIFAGYRIAQ